jgi:hypothetical protein
MILDTFHTCFMLESLSVNLCRSPYRRLCAWAQRYSAPEGRVGDHLEHEAQEPVAERFYYPRPMDPGEDQYTGCFVDDVWHADASPVSYRTNS